MCAHQHVLNAHHTYFQMYTRLNVKKYVNFVYASFMSFILTVLTVRTYKDSLNKKTIKGPEKRHVKATLSESSVGALQLSMGQLPVLTYTMVVKSLHVKTNEFDLMGALTK